MRPLNSRNKWVRKDTTCFSFKHSYCCSDATNELKMNITIFVMLRKIISMMSLDLPMILLELWKNSISHLKTTVIKISTQKFSSAFLHSPYYAFFHRKHKYQPRLFLLFLTVLTLASLELLHIFQISLFPPISMLSLGEKVSHLKQFSILQHSKWRRGVFC